MAKRAVESCEEGGRRRSLGRSQPGSSKGLLVDHGEGEGGWEETDLGRRIIQQVEGVVASAGFQAGPQP